MTPPASRRGFLRGLTTLPLIGGSVALIGQPTGPASPVTPGMIAHYAAWLHHEREMLMHSTVRGPGNPTGFNPCIDEVMWTSGWNAGLEGAGLAAQARAPVILAAVGVPLTSPFGEEWSTVFEVHPALSGRPRTV